MQQVYMPPISKINKIIAVTAATTFLLNLILSKLLNFDLVSLFAYSHGSFLSYKFFSLFTYPLVSDGFFETLFSILMLWMLGSEFENIWGIKRYLKFLATVTFGGVLFYELIVGLFLKAHWMSLPIMGLQGIVGALCITYAVVFPRRIFSIFMIIPIEARFFAPILALILLWQGYSSPRMVAVYMQLGAILGSLLFMYLVLIISQKGRSDSSQALNGLSKLFKTHKKSKAKLSIVKNNDEDPPKYWH